MNPSTFNNLISSVKETSFTDDQVDTIKTAIQMSRTIRSSQVAQLIKLLSFDDAKLEVVKMAYGHCIDPSSYAATVGGMLSFSDEKSALNEYIRNYGWHRYA